MPCPPLLKKPLSCFFLNFCGTFPVFWKTFPASCIGKKKSRPVDHRGAADLTSPAFRPKQTFLTNRNSCLAAVELQMDMDLDQDTFSCPICLDLLKEPVTTPCGHSYCRTCLETHWDAQDKKGVHTCPECRQSFGPRPGLVKSTMLAALMEQLKKTGVQAADGDVTCDFCCGRKLKAVKSCLQCLASYCDAHLQPHYQSAAFGKHKLVEATWKLQENICSRHNEVMTMFCRRDQRLICYLCSVDKHKGHDVVTAAAERADRQRALGSSRLNIQQKIQQRQKDVTLLQQEAGVIGRSADKTVEDGKKIFSEMMRLLEKRSADLERQVRSQQEAEVARVQEHQEKLEQEIQQLRSKDAELQKISETLDNNQFLKNSRSPPGLSGFSDSPGFTARPLKLEAVTEAASDLKLLLEQLLSNTTPDETQDAPGMDVLLSDPEPKTRADFLKYAVDITLNQNTANMEVLLSADCKRATLVSEPEPYLIHPDRFLFCRQVMGHQALVGPSYWEVSRIGRLFIAVSYRSISRASSSLECRFGHNDKSWTLNCEKKKTYEFCHNKVTTHIRGPGSSRVGVYLDPGAGILSFYSISTTMTMTLIHSVRTTFTAPLHAGLGLYHNYGDMAEICRLQQGGR